MSLVRPTSGRVRGLNRVYLSSAPAVKLGGLSKHAAASRTGIRVRFS